MVLMNLCAQMLSHVQLFVTPWTGARQAPLHLCRQQQRHRHREQTCGHSGGRRGWSKLRGEHGSIYITICITICKIDSQWESAVWHWQLNPVLCDKLKGCGALWQPTGMGWDGLRRRDGVGRWNGVGKWEGGARVGQWRHIYGCFMSIYGRNKQHCKAIILQLKLILKSTVENKYIMYLKLAKRINLQCSYDS